MSAVQQTPPSGMAGAEVLRNPGTRQIGAAEYVSLSHPLLLLVLITGVAAGLRCIGLNSQLWCDEIVTLINAVRVPTGTLVTTYFWDNQHTLYSLMAQVCVAWFGEAPWTLRLPAMVCGTLSIPVLYLLGREVTDRFESLAAAALLAVSYHHVWFSQNARGYTALLLATLLATWCLIRGLKRRTWGPWLLYAPVVALGMYCHLTMLFVVISHGLVCGWLLLRPQGDVWGTTWRQSTVGFALSGILTFLLYAPMLADVLAFFLHKPTGMTTPSTPGWALGEGWKGLVQGLGGDARIAVPLLFAAVLVVACGLGSYFRRDAVVLALFVLPGLITIAGALAARGTMYPRFFFSLAGFALLIVVRGIAVLGSKVEKRLCVGSWPNALRRPGLIAALSFALLLAGSAAALAANYRLPKQDFEGAMAYVEAARAGGEPIVLAGEAATFCCQRFYGKTWPEVRGTSQVSALRAQRAWLVYAFPHYLAIQDPALATAVREQFTVVSEFPGTLRGGSILVCRAEPSVPEQSIP